MEDINLFGEIQKYYEPEKEIILSPYQKLKKQMRYRKANVLKGESYCKHCNNFMRIEYHDKTYFKCKLIGESNSEATDIRAKNTCDQFKPMEIE